MLRELSVRNLAVIEDVRVELSPGFSAWTGETGAGKSLLLGAVGLLLGERGSVDLIRAGADELRVHAVFDVDANLKAAASAVLDTELGNEPLIISRRLGRSGRSQAYVNDQPVTLNLLRRLGGLLIDLHGQHENFSLLEPAHQLDLLDAFGRLEPQVQRYRDHWLAVKKLRERHHDLSAAREQRQRDLTLLRFEREELAAAQLRPDEGEVLETERRKLAHALSLQTFALGAYARLYEEEGAVVEVIGKLVREGDTWSEFDPRLADAVKRLHQILEDLRDVADSLRALGEGYEADPGRLEEIEQRLAQLRRLQAKYHRPVDDLIPYLASLDAREAELQQAEDDLVHVEADLNRRYADLRSAALELSKQRGKIAKKLAATAQKHLADLGMADAKLTANLTSRPLGDDALHAEIPTTGMDQLELMLAANPGEETQPLRKVASGGELARTMLALKTVLAAHDQVGTLIFDEIDANIGGRLGDVIGRMLATLGQQRQVICVTHLPQVACYAKQHWTIRKDRQAGRTMTSVAVLESASDRLEELASMLRGESKGATTRQEANAMLKAAKKWWSAPG